MNKFFLIILLAVITLFFSTQVYAASGHDTHKSGHGSHDMNNAKEMETGHEEHASGMKIHESSQNGYIFEYRLIDMGEKMKKMKNMPKIKETHHLMVFVRDVHGTAVKKAKVGYFIEEKASGDIQKKMAMAMNSGFGADVILAPGGHYMIKTKVIAGTNKLVDEFKYMGDGH